MLQKFITPRAIGILSILIGLVGIAAEVLSVFHLSYYYKFAISTLFALVDLSLFKVSQIHVYGLNSLNLFFYMLLLTGGILYVRSRYSETRLIRFGFSIILFAISVGFLISASIKLLDIFSDSGDYVSLRATSPVISVIAYTFRFAWIYLLYHVLKQLEHTKPLKMTGKEYGEETILVLHPASAWLRLLHWLLDLAVMLLILSPVIEALIFSLRIDEQMALLVIPLIFVLLRVLYFLPLEFAFGATPAKLLTESRVVTENGEAPSFATVHGRTFSRFVPLEPLSFLWNGRWHDQWSATEVVKEQRTGVNGGAYTLMLPAFLVVVLGLSEAVNSMEERAYAAQMRQVNDERKQGLFQKLDNLTSNDMLVLEGASYGVPKVWLKVETVTNDSIRFTRIEQTDHTQVNSHTLVQYYTANSPELEKETFSKQEIRQVIETAPDYPRQYLFLGSTRYGIAAIEAFYMPSSEFRN